MIKFYPSAATFSLGTENAADFASQCHRAQWLMAHDIRRPDDITMDHREIGAAFEDNIYKSLCVEFGNENIVKEKPLTLISDESWYTSGRCDFVATFENGQRMAVECKSTKSSSTATEFRQGRIRYYHLCQILIYMATLKTNMGRLYCGVYKLNKVAAKLELSYTRCYDIETDDDGKIFVDGVEFIYSFYDVFNGFDAVADHYYEGTVPDRPREYDNVWKSPCLRCAFAEACDGYEDTGEVPTYINRCRTISEKGAKT